MITSAVADVSSPKGGVDEKTVSAAHNAMTRGRSSSAIAPSSTTNTSAAATRTLTATAMPTASASKVAPAATSTGQVGLLGSRAAAVVIVVPAPGAASFQTA